MKKLIILTCLLLLVCSSAMARSIPGAPNEVEDPWFEDQNAWYVESGTWPVTDFTTGTSFQGGYFRGGTSAGESQFLRTIVDDQLSPTWNPDYNIKEIDFTLYAHLDGGGYLKVCFDWWNDPTIPRPSNDPNDTTSPPPDGRTPWYTATAYDPGDFQYRPDLILEGEDPGWFTDAPLNFHDIWDHQPRWVSIEIELGIHPEAQTGGEAFITGVDFEARCIPEPATIVLLAIGALGLLGYAWRRRNA